MLGSVGSALVFFILSFSLLIIYNSYADLKNNNHIIPFIFLFITEIFPLKSTGSFFTTGNASYIFLILAILIGMVRKEENSIEK